MRAGVGAHSLLYALQGGSLLSPIVPPPHLQPLVMHVRVGDLDRDVLELDVLPGGGAVRHHATGRTVELVVLDVQERQLAPVALLLARPEGQEEKVRCKGRPEIDPKGEPGEGCVKEGDEGARWGERGVYR